MLIEEANGETLAKMGDAYISLDRAEKLFRNGSCFTELFEILGTMGSQTFELKNDSLVTGIYSNGDFSAKIVEAENVPEYIETEDYKFVFESVKRSNA